MVGYAKLARCSPCPYADFAQGSLGNWQHRWYQWKSSLFLLRLAAFIAFRRASAGLQRMSVQMCVHRKRIWSEYHCARFCAHSRSKVVVNGRNHKLAGSP